MYYSSMKAVTLVLLFFVAVAEAYTNGLRGGHDTGELVENDERIQEREAIRSDRIEELMNRIQFLKEQVEARSGSINGDYDSSEYDEEDDEEERNNEEKMQLLYETHEKINDLRNKLMNLEAKLQQDDAEEGNDIEQEEKIINDYDDTQSYDDEQRKEELLQSLKDQVMMLKENLEEAKISFGGFNDEVEEQDMIEEGSLSESEEEERVRSPEEDSPLKQHLLDDLKDRIQTLKTNLEGIRDNEEEEKNMIEEGSLSESEEEESVRSGGGGSLQADSLKQHLLDDLKDRIQTLKTNLEGIRDNEEEQNMIEEGSLSESEEEESVRSGGGGSLQADSLKQHLLDDLKDRIQTLKSKLEIIVQDDEEQEQNMIEEGSLSESEEEESVRSGGGGSLQADSLKQHLLDDLKDRIQTLKTNLETFVQDDEEQEENMIEEGSLDESEEEELVRSRGGGEEEDALIKQKLNELKDRIEFLKSNLQLLESKKYDGERGNFDVDEYNSQNNIEENVEQLLEERLTDRINALKKEATAEFQNIKEDEDETSLFNYDEAEEEEFDYVDFADFEVNKDSSSSSFEALGEDAAVKLEEDNVEDEEKERQERIDGLKKVLLDEEQEDETFQKMETEQHDEPSFANLEEEEEMNELMEEGKEEANLLLTMDAETKTQVRDEIHALISAINEELEGGESKNNDDVHELKTLKAEVELIEEYINEGGSNNDEEQDIENKEEVNDEEEGGGGGFVDDFFVDDAKDTAKENFDKVKDKVSGWSNAAKIGLGVGLGVVSLCFISALFMFCCRKNK